MAKKISISPIALEKMKKKSCAFTIYLASRGG